MGDDAEVAYMGLAHRKKSILSTVMDRVASGKGSLPFAALGMVSGEGRGFRLAEDLVNDETLHQAELIDPEPVSEEQVGGAADGNADEELEEDFDEGIELVRGEGEDGLGQLRHGPGEERSEDDLRDRQKERSVMPEARMAAEKDIEQRYVHHARDREGERKRFHLEVLEEERNQHDMERLARECHIERRAGILEREEGAGEERDETLGEKREREELQDFEGEDGVFPVEVSGPQNHADELGAEDDKRERERDDEEKDAARGLREDDEEILPLLFGCEEAQGREDRQRKSDAEKAERHALDVVGEDESRKASGCQRRGEGRHRKQAYLAHSHAQRSRDHEGDHPAHRSILPDTETRESGSEAGALQGRVLDEHMEECSQDHSPRQPDRTEGRREEPGAEDDAEVVEDRRERIRREALEGDEDAAEHGAHAEEERREQHEARERDRKRSLLRTEAGS